MKRTMTEHLLKISKAIANIDGGCSTCIEHFLARCYKIESFDVYQVVQKINSDGTFTKITAADVMECVNNQYYE